MPSCTRLALISDIHGNLPALQAVVADLADRKVDQVLCLGDHLSGPLLPLETARYLMQRQHEGWVLLAGNHERQILEWTPASGGAADGFARARLGSVELDWLRTLRPVHEYSAELLLCHGTPRRDDEFFLESVRHRELLLARPDEMTQRCDGRSHAVIAGGHSHVPRSLRLPSGQLLVNPGSVGLQAYIDDTPQYCTMQLGTVDAQYAIIERTDAGWHCEHHSVRYDFESMAGLAQSNGQPIWAPWLRTGFVDSP